MDKDFFKYLPSEIVFDIFSKLPIQSIGFCKCVCKSWRNLVGTHEFAKLHLSQSTAPCLVYRRGLGTFSIFELNDDLDLEHHELHYKIFTNFTFLSEAVALQGSTDGLLFLRRDQYYGNADLYICNPITRDYIKLPYEFSLFRGDKTATYGFGASKMSGQHKVVGIFHGFKRDNSGRVIGASKSKCRVYTLGTRSWRSIAASSAGNPLNYVRGDMYNGAVFVNGNLHWLATDDVNGERLISCFDLETEVFRTFPPPLRGKLHGDLSVLGNFLSFCEKRSGGGMVIIWLAKDEKCWTKEFVINTSIIHRSCSMYPIKVFGDGGDILIAPSMFCYSAKTKKSSQKFSIFDLECSRESVIYTPSFLSLKCFEIETATSF